MTTLAQTPPPAAALSTRVGPLAAVRHALTLAWRSLVQIRHNPMELGDLSLQPLMFVLLFAYVFGGAMAGSPRAYLQGVGRRRRRVLVPDRVDQLAGQHHPVGVERQPDHQGAQPRPDHLDRLAEADPHLQRAEHADGQVAGHARHSARG
jgi:hypothetical protein